MPSVEDPPGEQLGHLNFAQGLAIAVTCSIFSAIWIIVRPRGLVVQVCTCSFVLSLVCTQLLMKELASSVKFRYPANVTSLHFLSVWLVSWMFWAAQGELFHRCNPASLGSSRRFFYFRSPHCSQSASVHRVQQHFVAIHGCWPCWGGWYHGTHHHGHFDTFSGPENQQTWLDGGTSSNLWCFIHSNW